MFGLHENKKLLIDVNQLKKPKLKGVHAIGLFIRLSGRLDAKRDLIRMEGNMVKSPWLARRQSYYDKYSSDIYKVAGNIMKEALVKREKINDEIKFLRKELVRKEEELSASGDTPGTVEEKRMAAGTKKAIDKIEAELMEKVERLKEVKIAIDEATHQLYQIMQSKNKIMTGQMITYLRGAKQFTYGDELLIENAVSRTLYEKLGEGFEYCIDIDELLCREEKESGHYERI